MYIGLTYDMIDNFNQITISKLNYIFATKYSLRTRFHFRLILCQKLFNQNRLNIVIPCMARKRYLKTWLVVFMAKSFSFSQFFFFDIHHCNSTNGLWRLVNSVCLLLLVITLQKFASNRRGGTINTCPMSIPYSRFICTKHIL